MAAITLETAPQKQRIRGQVKTVLAAVHEMLDTFVSNRMRLAASEAEHALPRQPQHTSSLSINAR
jgi:hypothetical protein